MTGAKRCRASFHARARAAKAGRALKCAAMGRGRQGLGGRAGGSVLRDVRRNSQPAAT